MERNSVCYPATFNSLWCSLGRTDLILHDFSVDSQKRLIIGVQRMIIRNFLGRKRSPGGRARSRPGCPWPLILHNASKQRKIVIVNSDRRRKSHGGSRLFVLRSRTTSSTILDYYFGKLISSMPIFLASRQPILSTREQRIPSAEMQVSCSKPKIVVSKKSVQFYKIIDIRSTIHINDMTDEEIARAWYSHGEMKSIKRTMTSEVNSMTLGEPIMGADHTTRGLEFRTREGRERKKTNRFVSINAVLDEQDIQFMRCYNDPNGLRKVYSGHSRRCLSESQALGKADQIEVSLIRQDTGPLYEPY